MVAVGGEKKALETHEMKSSRMQVRAFIKPIYLVQVLHQTFINSGGEKRRKNETNTVLYIKKKKSKIITIKGDSYVSYFAIIISQCIYI